MTSLKVLKNVILKTMSKLRHSAELGRLLATIMQENYQKYGTQESIFQHKQVGTSDE